MKFKARLRIPTEMYAYIEVDVEGTPEDIVSQYQQFMELVKPQSGIPTKEFNQFLDNMLQGESNGTETWAAMSPKQQFVVNEVKKTIKRITPNEHE